MTYREFLEELKKLSEDELDQDMIIYREGKYLFPEYLFKMKDRSGELGVYLYVL